jgi:hypothetical protein
VEWGVVGRYAEASWKTRVSEQLCVLVLSVWTVRLCFSSCVCFFFTLSSSPSDDDVTAWLLPHHLTGYITSSSFLLFFFSFSCSLHRACLWCQFRPRTAQGTPQLRPVGAQ